MIQKIEDVKRPVKEGEYYLVPCFVREVFEDQNNGEVTPKLYITPVINHPHNDIENGQKEIHYHVDFRFVQKSTKNKVFVEHFRPTPEDGEIEYMVLRVRNEEFSKLGMTDVSFIKNSKLKHKCIHKGKCPHRGYDLSQVKPKNGKITCPLHGLEFDEITHKLLNHEKN